MNKLLVGNKSDLTSKKVVEYSVAKVCGNPNLNYGTLGRSDITGIRGPTLHPLPRDFGEERDERRAGVLDHGEADQGSVRLSAYTPDVSLC